MLEVAPISPEFFVLAQEVELTQALVNLLRNAAAASLSARVRDRTIFLRTRAKGDSLEIEVSNHIAPARATSGMGVGLIIARTIIEAHGGSLRREHDAARIHFVMSLPSPGKPS